MPDLDWVTTRLAIGGKVESLYDARAIAAQGVTHVLSLRAGDINPEHVSEEKDFWKQVGSVEFKNNPTHDDGEPKGEDWFKRSIDYAFEVITSSPGNKLFIHCKDGEHRSPVTAYAILRAWGTNEDDAVKHVESSRKEADVDEYKTDADLALKRMGYI